MATIPTLQRPKKPEESAAYGGGAAMRNAFKIMPHVGELLAETTGGPQVVRNMKGAAADFGRGLLGQAPTVASPVPAAGASPVARPPNPVAGLGALPNYLSPGDQTATAPAAASLSAPRAAPVAQGPALSAGGIGSDASSRVLGSFTGKNGTQTITSDYQAPSTGPGLSVVPAGVVPLPDAARTSPAAPMSRPTLQTPIIGRTQGSLIGSGPTAEQERLSSLSRLNEQIDSLGTLNSRGKRQFASDLLQLRTGLTQQAGTLAGRRDETQLDANTRIAATQMGEQGQNGRAELEASTRTEITGMNQRGENARAELSQAGENFRLLNRPEYQADASGVMNRVANGVARPVTNEKGEPLRTVTADQQKATERRHEVLDSISARAVDSLPLGRNASVDEIQTARAQAAITNGFQVIVNDAGERMVSIDGQWVAL